jgi:hypothetical protein
MVIPEARNQGRRLIFRPCRGRRGNTSRAFDAFGYVEHREMSVGSRPVESHCEEKQAKPEGATPPNPGAHEKEARSDPLHPYRELVQVL